MSLPAKYKIELYAGDTQSFSFRLRNSDGIPVAGLSEAEAVLTASVDFTKPPAIQKIGEIIESDGSITFNFSPEETSILVGTGDVYTRKSFKYDIQLTYTDSLDVVYQITTILFGDLIVYEDVTK